MAICSRLSVRCILALVSFQALAATPAVPPKLRLPASVAPVSYQVALNLDPGKAVFSGSISIKVQVNQPVDVVWLNANKIVVDQASIVSGGKTASAKPLPGGDDFLGLQLENALQIGPAEIRIRYSGTVRQQDSSGIFRMEDNGNRYLYTQFESTDARAAFPCFDEPSYKVPWQLTLDIPSKDVAVSNTSARAEQTRGERKIINFDETKPLPSYLVAFAVGPFDFVPAGRAGRNSIPIRIVTPKGHADEAKYAAEVTGTIIDHLEAYFGMPFPYDKSDQVAIPVTFGFGAMENAGMVTYAQNIILAKPERDTEDRRRLYASVAAHELAHQWFGDLVTTAWWNDIWLNEAFATWMEQKILKEWKPEWKTRVEDVNSKLNVESQDSLTSARKIRQEIETKDDISNAFDDITYQKGAAVIGMFESWVGNEQFRKGVQSYLKQHAFGTATSSEFLDSISSASGKNIGAAFSSFLNQPGVPLVSMSMDCDQNKATVRLSQERFLPLGSNGTTAQVWQIPVCIRYGTEAGEERECSLLSQTQSSWTLKGRGCPTFLEGNDNAIGYYRTDYRGSLTAQLTKVANARLSDPERVDFMGDIESLASAGKLPMADALGLAQDFAGDPERHVVQSALEVALAPDLHLVPDGLRPNYRRFLLRSFQARARSLGWTPPVGEPDNEKLLRPALLSAVATTAGDQDLAGQAKSLCAGWLKDHTSLSPNLAKAVLASAAYYGDKSLFDQFLREFKNSKDRQERKRIIGAMASFRDPAAIEAGMEAVLRGDIPMIEGSALLFAGTDSPETRHMAFEFLKAHFDEIVSKRPTGGGSDFGASLSRVGEGFCDAQSRTELESFLKPRVQRFTGGPRRLAQTLEQIDICIAEKKAQEPAVAAFLSKY